MDKPAANPFGHCRELALRPGSLFEFSSRFLPQGQLEPMLALYALLQAVGSVPRLTTDDAVKWAKLKWWAEELAADPATAAHHPVVRALCSSGASARIGRELLQRLVNDAAFQVDAAPVNDEEEWFERYALIGSTWIRMELALRQSSMDERIQGYLGAASAMYSLLMEAGGTLNLLNRDLPLGLLIRHGVKSGIGPEQQLAELAELMRHLAAMASDWYAQGRSGLQLPGARSGNMHVQLRCALEHRHLVRISRKSPLPASPGRRFGPADAWYAWRLCRRLNRQGIV